LHNNYIMCLPLVSYSVAKCYTLIFPTPCLPLLYEVVPIVIILNKIAFYLPPNFNWSLHQFILTTVTKFASQNTLLYVSLSYKKVFEGFPIFLPPPISSSLYPDSPFHV
jgi:hypothetical protein